MKNLNICKRLLALMLALCMLLTFAACGEEEQPATNANTDTQPGVTAQTVVTVHNSIGAPLADVQVYVYTDDTQEELVSFTKTDAEGKAVCTTS